MLQGIVSNRTSGEHIMTQASVNVELKLAWHILGSLVQIVGTGPDLACWFSRGSWGSRCQRMISLVILDGKPTLPRLQLAINLSTRVHLAGIVCLTCFVVETFFRLWVAVALGLP